MQNAGIGAIRRLGFTLGLVVAILGIHAQSTDSIISRIRQEFARINADSLLTKKTISGEEFLPNAYDGGAELTGYYRRDSLVKIVEWVGLSFGNSIREFYWKNGQLMFVFARFDQFQLNDSLDAINRSATRTVFEGRYYFQNGKLISQINKGHYPTGKKTENGAEMMQTAKDLRAKLQRF